MQVLLLNPKFPYSFWSFDRVCEMIGCKTLFPPLGLITVAALLPAAWEIRLKDLNAESVGEADWEWADLVMMTGMLIQRENLLELIREAKQRQKKIVVGGCYPSAAPEEVTGCRRGCGGAGRGGRNHRPTSGSIGAGRNRGGPQINRLAGLDAIALSPV